MKGCYMASQVVKYTTGINRTLVQSSSKYILLIITLKDTLLSRLLFYGLFTRWIGEINLKDSENVPARMPALHRISFIKIHINPKATTCEAA